MIRLGKPVRLLEWGVGTNTTNQRWEPIGEGTLRSKPKRTEGITTLEIEVNGALKRQNPADDAIKVMQPGEGMTSNTARWGEVAMGRLSRIEIEGGKTIVYIEVKAATKVGH